MHEKANTFGNVLIPEKSVLLTFLFLAEHQKDERRYQGHPSYQFLPRTTGTGHQYTKNL